MTDENAKSSPAADNPETAALPIRDVYVSFEELANGQNEIGIDYNGQRYRLRVTKNGRLILNK